MKLIGFRVAERTMIGVEHLSGEIATLTLVDDFYARLPFWLRIARSGVIADTSRDQVELAPPVPRSARILCVGLNYHAHAAEGGREVPSVPTIFGRWHASLATSGAPVAAVDARLDWEGELAAIVGQRLCMVDPTAAATGVLGYAAFNDISARTFQQHTSQWTVGKNADGTGVVGSITTTDETGDPADGLRIETRLNGETVQSSSTAAMIFSVGDILAYVSQVLTLNPGDIIATGTPEGVGQSRRPPRFMRPGDRVEVEIERVGSVKNEIVAR